MKLPRIHDIQPKDPVKSRLPPIETIDIDEQKEKFKTHFNINVKDVGDKEDYDGIGVSYERLMNIFNKNYIEKGDMLNTFREEIKSFNICSLEDLEYVVENGLLDLNKYDTYTMTKIIEELKRKTKGLNEYGILTMDDFYCQVASGKLDVSKYTESELDSFLDILMKKWVTRS